MLPSLRRGVLCLLGLGLFVLSSPSLGAPITIDANRVAGPARTGPGTGVCATAVHLTQDDRLTDPTIARAVLAQPIGGLVDGRVTFNVPTIDLRSRDPDAAGDYRDDRGLPFSAQRGAPVIGDEKNISMRVRGYLNIPNAGVYTLAVLTDGGYQLLVGGISVLSSNALQSLRDSQPVDFKTGGMFPLELLYFHNSGPALIELSQADLKEREGRQIPTPLGPNFHLVFETELYSAVRGESSCAECKNTSDCAPGSYCRDGLCQPCLFDDRCGSTCQVCPAVTPLCLPGNGGTCVECGAASTRVCDAKGYLCSLNKCVPCTADSQCGAGRICDTAFGQCIARPNIQYMGGCAVTPGAGGASGASGAGAPWAALPLLLLLLVWPFRRPAATRTRRWLILGLLLVAGPARAQTSDPLRFNTQTFRPMLGPGAAITVDGSLMPPRLFPVGGVFFQYANRPLRGQISGTGEIYDTPVPGQVTVHLLPGIGFTPWFALFVDLPLVVYQPFDTRTPSGDVPVTPTVAGLGDARAGLKFRLKDNLEGGFGAAAALWLTGPTGSTASLRGDGTFGIEPRVMLDYRFRRGAFIALNASYYLRTYNRTVDFGLLRVTDQLRYGLGAGVPLGKGLGLVGEVTGAVSFSALQGGPFYHAAEGLLGLRWAHASGFEVTLGGGGAFLAPVGTPNFRGFASVGYVPAGKRPVPKPKPKNDDDLPPPNPDPDGDGVLGAADKCPDQAGPADNGGCPDTDEDKDGVPDRLDQCPKEPGRVALHGCPIEDKDKDGVPDYLDKCPDEAGSADKDGCPGGGDKPGADKPGADKPGADKPGADAACADGDPGCGLVTVEEDVVKLAQPIRFQAGGVAPEKDSVKVLVALGKVLKANPGLKIVLTVAPADASKPSKKLAAGRAKILGVALTRVGAGKGQAKVLLSKTPGEEEIAQAQVQKGKAPKAPKGKAPKAPKAGKGKRRGK